MKKNTPRQQTWDNLAADWDLLIIGGGITGAGILREAARLGLKALLVEQHDFASGTSSRSSKLVHGGLRYLKQGRLLLTQASVHEREALLHEGPGLIDPLGFLLTVYQGDFPGRLTFKMGLTVYDLLALRWDHRYYSPQDFRMLAPHLSSHDLEGGFRYGDAQTDDARLVLRVLNEAVADGACAFNYVQAQELLRDAQGQVIGARLWDAASGQSAECRSRVVISATGAWADGLRGQLGAAPRLRPLRGSHLIFPAWRVPVAQAVSFLHPFDRRPVFIFPWEDVTLVGTTDEDHAGSLNEEACISPDEVAYLMAAVESQFPTLGLTLNDIISSFSGVRPVIGSGKADPSKESRDHVVWDEDGLLTVTGGKLTTFRLIALDVLKAVRHRLPEIPEVSRRMPVLNHVDEGLLTEAPLSEKARRRLLGRYGAQAPTLVQVAQPGELEAIPGLQTLWAELRWAAHAENVLHLDDLLLRRTRIGLMLPHGGEHLLAALRPICKTELGWTEAQWKAELKRYRALWQGHYSLPEPTLVPDWRPALAEALARRRAILPRRRKIVRRSALAGGLVLLALLGLGLSRYLYRRHKKNAQF